MKSSAIGKRFLSLFVVAILLVGLCCPLSAMAAEEKVLRVGYMDYQGFIDIEADGSFTGYGIEYLAEISKHTDYRFEYVYGQWSDLLVMLQNKEIDLLCTAQYSEERAKTFDFSAFPIGYTQGLLYGKEDTPLCYEDYTAFNGMTVGVLRKSAMISLLQQYSKKHDFSCKLVEYNTEEEMLSALEREEIEAMCTEHLANHTGLSLLAKLGADAYYIISYKNSPYMEEINYALKEIKINVDLEADLYHKYYGNSSAESTVSFTTAEKEYIARGQAIRVGLNQNRAPFSAYDEKTGTFSGICVDILELIAEESGLIFEYIPLPPSMTSPQLMETGDYDLICGIERDNFITNPILTSTNAFLESAIVPVGHSGVSVDMSQDLIAAVPASFQALQRRLSAEHPNLHLVFYPTNRDCLNALVSGDADVFIQNTHVLSLLLQEPRFESLDVIPIEIMTEHSAIALNRSGDEMLLSILNKCIGNLDMTAVNSSLIEHTFASPYLYTVNDFLYKFKAQIVVITILVLICFILFTLVVTFQHRNEAKLQEKNALLAEAVAQADRASTAKSQFLSRMSHEIRTPMNAIVGLTEIARQHENETNKIDDYLDKISISSKVLLNIINDVLDMSAIESNKLKIASDEFDIKQVLSSISTIYYPQCQSKGIKLQMATDVENELLIGDALRVNQVLLNLVSNAYKFTESGGTISIYVKETARKGDTAFLRFTVSDTGCGMTEDMKARLFKPFEQETAGTAQRHGGSGLGLSIAKNLVDMMHGAISVESEKGKGTSFFVDLPFGIAARASVQSSDALKSVRVLVVDDDAAAIEYTTIVLQRIGVAFYFASSGTEALEMLEAAEKDGQPYDVCLIDWKMPDMDGLEVTRRIRANEKNRSLIIIVSAYDLNEVHEEAENAGADHFVSKPLFQSTVFNVLMTLTHGELKHETAQNKEYDFTGHRVLLAEDQELNAEIAIELLGLVKMQADHASNGKEALDMFSSSAPGTYDAILMDVQMPVMDGYESSAKIRELEHPDAKKIPIFAMTANAFTEDVAAAISAGMNGHIAKPIDTKILYDTLNKAINGNA